MKPADNFEIVADRLTGLNSDQIAQISRQIQYHLTAPPYEDLILNRVVSLHFDISCGVTRPMSSKGLAKWLWDAPHLYSRNRVLDLGTGCGVQGITCLLGGAEYVLFSDLSEAAVECAKSNLSAAGLSGRAEVRISNLFDDLGEPQLFDLIVFAQPYFSGTPVGDYPFTAGMLSERDLLPRFFQGARNFLQQGGRVALMGWSFAGEGNDPALVGPQYGFEQVWRGPYRTDAGVQRGEFHIVLFK